MTTPPSFPTLAGQGWSVHKKPNWSTIVAPHVSGREVRFANYEYPLWEFEATFDGLTNLASPPTNYANLGASSLQSLMGLFLQLQGQFGTFLYTDPTDNSVSAQAVAAGNSSTQSFLMQRSLGGFAEPVGWVTSIAAVYLNGVLQSGGWYFVAPNSLLFYEAPGSGVAVTASFSFAFECRFDDDSLDFEEFMSSLWNLESVKFRSVRSNITAAAPMANPTQIVFASRGVNLNATGDTAVPIVLPAGVTTYQASLLVVANSSGALPSTARIGIYTQPSQGGVAIASQQALSGITSQATDTNDNSMRLTVNNSATTAFDDATLYINVGTAQGATATADILISIVLC